MKLTYMTNNKAKHTCSWTVELTNDVVYVIDMLWMVYAIVFMGIV